jgi:hypothetical protein
MKEDRKSDSRCDMAELFGKRREEYTVKREKRSQDKKAELNKTTDKVGQGRDKTGKGEIR